MRRRDFVQNVAGLAAGSLAAGSLVPEARAALRDLRITKVETVYWPDRNAAPWWPHWTWVRIHTDAGIVGLGETYPRTAQEAAAIHDAARMRLLGNDPRDIAAIWRDLYQRFDYNITGGAEMRAISAIDLALWDLLGKALETPVYRLIGGKSNPRVRVYNTCFPHKYDFLRDPDKIMREVMEGYGVTDIKVWPFDSAARKNKGQFITQSQIDEALLPIRKLRDAFGDKIEILVEFHSNWNVTAAARIAKALEPLKPMWLEDMLLPGDESAFRQLAEATPLPLTISERMAGVMSFRKLLAERVAQFVMFDVCWCGGLSEARNITKLADAHQVPFAAHTAGGPLLFYASTHLSTAATNLWIQESCQRFYERDWPMMLENPIVPSGGAVQVPELPGFGMQVKPEVWNHPAIVRQVSEV